MVRKKIFEISARSDCYVIVLKFKIEGYEIFVTSSFEQITYVIVALHACADDVTLKCIPNPFFREELLFIKQLRT